VRASALAGILLALACTPREPPSWPQGGAALVIAPARWDRGDDDPIEIRADGRVLEDGDVLFVLDRVGRIVDPDYDPLAILLPDGRLVGTDDALLGHVGVTNAAPPWSGTAWLAVLPDGAVTYFDSDGSREFGGRWRGCGGAAHRTCTLVTQFVALRNYRPPAETGVGIGIGIGVGL
jgi:hypothetical protein